LVRTVDVNAGDLTAFRVFLTLKLKEWLDLDGSLFDLLLLHLVFVFLTLLLLSLEAHLGFTIFVLVVIVILILSDVALRVGFVLDLFVQQLSLGQQTLNNLNGCHHGVG